MSAGHHAATDVPRRQWVIDKTWRFHRSVVLDRVETGESGTWAQIRRGAEVRTYGGSLSVFDFEALVFFPVGGWWSALFLDEAPIDVHVDVATPAALNGEVITSVDLDLDVIVQQGEATLVDRDEFTDHRVRHSYPDLVVREAERAASDVLSMIEASIFPFDGNHRSHFDELCRRSTERHRY